MKTGAALFPKDIFVLLTTLHLVCWQQWLAHCYYSPKGKYFKHWTHHVFWSFEETGLFFLLFFSSLCPSELAVKSGIFVFR